MKYIGTLPYVDTLRKMSSYDFLVLIEAKMDTGIFFPSKLVDYSQVNAPILAISPRQGYTSDLLSKFNAGIAVYNDEEDSIYYGLKRLIDLKIDNKLKDKFDLGSLQELYSTGEIIKQYKSIFKKLFHKTKDII